MRKFLVIFIPAVILVISIFVMLSGPLFKNPTGYSDNVPMHMDAVEKAVASSDWTSAKQSTNKLDTAWKSVIKRIQFSCERDEINALNVSIARLKASISAKDKTSALLELTEAQQHWADLGK